MNSQRGGNPSNVSAVVKFTSSQLAGLGAAEALPGRVVVARTSSNPGFGGLALEVD